MNQLHLAGVADMPEPPYPAKTYFGSMKQDNHPSRVEQSVTWQMAPDNIQPLLLMTWHKAWLQWPTGSLPSDPTELCAVLHLDRKVFDQHRATIMRGWYLANDGRYYHPILAEQVQRVLRRRAQFTNSKHKRSRTKLEDDDTGRGDGKLPPGFKFADTDQRKW